MESNRRNLIKQTGQNPKLPGMIDMRCVHSMVEIASCRACEAVCPHNAWLLDDDALRLDTNACDGCGLCVPACPEGAIHGQNEILIGHQQGSSFALCTCEYTASLGTEGVVSCIHAVGLQDILRLYRKGATEWIVSTADCDSCNRGKGVRLSDRLEAINRSLQQSGHTRLVLSYLSPVDWHRAYQKLTESSEGPQLSRRGFLSGILNAGLQRGMELFDLSNQETTTYLPPGQLIPDVGKATLWPFALFIDSDLCDGCDACARLCPHAAIVLDEGDTQAQYRLDPKNCTGCRICSDVCEQKAIKVYEWQPQVQFELALKNQQCSVCGSSFHRPVGQAKQDTSICRICSKHNHYKNLYQVLT